MSNKLVISYYIINDSIGSKLIILKVNLITAPMNSV